MGALHYIAESAFDNLLTCWRKHDDLQRDAAAAVPELGRSRAELDLARRRMNWLRAAMYPNGDEIDSTIVTTLCPTLDQVVHLSRRHRDPSAPGFLSCVCGQQIPLT